MIFATKIRMKAGCYSHESLIEIADIYLQGDVTAGYYCKESVHDFVKKYPGSIVVNIAPYPKLVEAVSHYGEKYVRSEPNGSVRDNLLQLPRE